MLSMLMVLVLHADYAALGAPDTGRWAVAPGASLLCVIMEQCSVVAVNVFVLISGWFGIRLSLRSVSSLLFQVVFYAVAVIGVVAAVKGIPPQQHFTAWMSLLPGYYHWFIRSYLGLMILAPVLNAFADRAQLRTLAIVTAGFFLFEFVYGFGFEADGFKHGYSLLSFIGLYLLARLARRGGWERLGAGYSAIIYGICVLGGTALSLYTLLTAGEISPRLTAYDSPLVVAGALALLLTFMNIAPGWSSRIVNGMAASCLAVYLLHFDPLVFNDYQGMCRRLFAGPLPLLTMTGFVLAVFLLSIVTDRVRILCWNLISKHLPPIFTKTIT